MRHNLTGDGAVRVLKAIADTYPECREALEQEYRKAKHGFRIEVKAIQLKRSQDANARYWTIVGALADYAGDTKEGMHEEVLCAYHGADVVVNRVTGMARREPRGRSHDMTTEDFSALMAIAEQWAAENGIVWEEPT